MVETHEMIVTRLERELEEARDKIEELEHNVSRAEEERADAEADLAEARQERDAAIAELQNYVTSVPKWAEKDKARIRELEAALRRIFELSKG